MLRVGSGQIKKRLSRPSILRVGSGWVEQVLDPLIRSSGSREPKRKEKGKGKGVFGSLEERERYYIS